MKRTRSSSTVTESPPQSSNRTDVNRSIGSYKMPRRKSQELAENSVKNTQRPNNESTKLQGGLIVNDALKCNWSPGLDSEALWDARCQQLEHLLSCFQANPFGIFNGLFCRKSLAFLNFLAALLWHAAIHKEYGIYPSRRDTYNEEGIILSTTAMYTVSFPFHLHRLVQNLLALSPNTPPGESFRYMERNDGSKDPVLRSYLEYFSWSYGKLQSTTINGTAEVPSPPSFITNGINTYLDEEGIISLFRDKNNALLEAFQSARDLNEKVRTPRQQQALIQECIPLLGSVDAPWDLRLTRIIRLLSLIQADPTFIYELAPKDCPKIVLNCIAVMVWYAAVHKLTGKYPVRRANYHAGTAHYQRVQRLYNAVLPPRIMPAVQSILDEFPKIGLCRMHAYERASADAVVVRIMAAYD